MDNLVKYVLIPQYRGAYHIVVYDTKKVTLVYYISTVFKPKYTSIPGRVFSVRSGNVLKYHLSINVLS